MEIYERWDNAPLWFYSCCIAVKLVSIKCPSIIFTTTGSPDTWGVRLLEQSNTEQNQNVPTVAASTSALQFEHLPSKVNTLSGKHDWRLQLLHTYFPLSNMCVIGTTPRTCRDVITGCVETRMVTCLCVLRLAGHFVWSCVYRESVYLKLRGLPLCVCLCTHITTHTPPHTQCDCCLCYMCWLSIKLHRPYF